MNHSQQKMICGLILVFGALLLGGASCSAPVRQGEAYNAATTLRYEDYVYTDSIRTVQLYRGNNETAYPILFLGESMPLTLEFDELIDPSLPDSRFWVDIVACDWNWQPASVFPIEFYKGYSRREIGMGNRSQFTKVNYTHYQYRFPVVENEDAFLQSGNYLLKVFRDGDENQLVLTRRFVVADRKAGIENNYTLDPNLERLLLSQLRFDVAPGGLNILNPSQDLIVQVLQNFRWDNYFQALRPRFIREDRYEYFVDLDLAFKGGGEFRHLDLRSTRLYGRTTADIEETESRFIAYSRPDKLKKSNFLIQFPDLNGNFYIAVNEWNAPDWQADYLENNFALDRDFPYDSSEVYLFGRLTDWRLQDRFRMDFNEVSDQYECSVLLKQGVYDYMYVLRHPGQRMLDEASLEGNPGEDENFYTVLVYFRAPTDRRHQLVGLQVLNYRL